MTKDKALKLALEALEECRYRSLADKIVDPAVTAIKEALAQPTSGEYALGYAEGFNDACKKPEQEPVKYEFQSTHDGKWYAFHDDKHYADTLADGRWPIRALYTTPPQRKPLTDAQVNECGMCGYVGKDKDKTGQCPKCRWDELRPLTGKAHQKPLTDDQIYEMYNEPRSDAEMLEFARAIEAAHGIKGEA